MSSSIFRRRRRRGSRELPRGGRRKLPHRRRHSGQCRSAARRCPSGLPGDRLRPSRAPRLDERRVNLSHSRTRCRIVVSSDTAGRLVAFLPIVPVGSRPARGVSSELSIAMLCTLKGDEYSNPRPTAGQNSVAVETPESPHWRGRALSGGAEGLIFTDNAVLLNVVVRR